MRPTGKRVAADLRAAEPATGAALRAYFKIISFTDRPAGIIGSTCSV
jgi:hypothetical protein